MARVLAVAGAAGVTMAVLAVAGLAVALAVVQTGSDGPNRPDATLSDIPPAMLSLYEVAATTCPGLSWTTLAAIGTVESDNGTSTAPGVTSGANAAGAEGPMQFEPRTFAEYDLPVPEGGTNPPSPYDPVDAVYAAARLLCANGAADGLDVAGAVYAYNHSTAYVTEVLELAAVYQGGDGD